MTYITFWLILIDTCNIDRDINLYDISESSPRKQFEFDDRIGYPTSHEFARGFYATQRESGTKQ